MFPQQFGPRPGWGAAMQFAPQFGYGVPQFSPFAAKGGGKGFGKGDNFKTSICQHWVNGGGVCPFEGRCRFAHGEHELQAKKRTFDQAYGAPAMFGGGYGAMGGGYGAPFQKRRRTDLFKTTLCAHFQAGGTCPFAERCNFAHGEEELRPAGAGAPEAAAGLA